MINRIVSVSNVGERRTTGQGSSRGDEATDPDHRGTVPRQPRVIDDWAETSKFAVTTD
jgi:hypothetical protein